MCMVGMPKCATCVAHYCYYVLMFNTGYSKLSKHRSLVHCICIHWRYSMRYRKMVYLILFSHFVSLFKTFSRREILRLQAEKVSLCRAQIIESKQFSFIHFFFCFVFCFFSAFILYSSAYRYEFLTANIPATIESLRPVSTVHSSIDGMALKKTHICFC